MATDYSKVEHNGKPIDIPKPTSSPVDDAIKNNEAPKEEPKKEPVAQAEVKAPTFWERKWENAKTSAKNSVKTVVIPTLKATVLEVAYNTLRNVIYDGNPPASTHAASSGGTVIKAAASKFAYDAVSKPKQEVQKAPEQEFTKVSQTGDYGKVPTLQFKTEEGARAIYNAMDFCLEQYDFVSIRDVYEYADLCHMIKGCDEKYGWTKMDGVRCYEDPVSHKWRLSFPNAYRRPE